MPKPFNPCGAGAFVSILRRFDRDQLEYLASRADDPEERRELAAAANAYRSVLAKINFKLEGGRAVGAGAQISDAALLEPLGSLLGRPLKTRTGEHWPGEGADVKGRVIAADLGPADAAWTSAWEAGRSPVVVVDGVLSPEALEAVRGQLLESTVWFDGAKPNGYVGAYVHDGLASEVKSAQGKERPR